jgi:hypothetical protein
MWRPYQADTRTASAKPRVVFVVVKEGWLFLLYRILFPGGGTYFDTPGGYAEAGQKLYQLAMRMNRGGDYFPVLGICLGFELLTYLASNNVEHRARCYSYNETLPLEFKARKLSSNLCIRACLTNTSRAGRSLNASHRNGQAELVISVSKTNNCLRVHS